LQNDFKIILKICFFFIFFAKIYSPVTFLQTYTNVIVSNSGIIASVISKGGWPLPPFEMSIVNSNHALGTVALPSGGRGRSIFKKLTFFIYSDGDKLCMKNDSFRRDLQLFTSNFFI
jgi:hypothetical protein